MPRTEPVEDGPAEAEWPEELRACTEDTPPGQVPRRLWAEQSHAAHTVHVSTGSACLPVMDGAHLPLQRAECGFKFSL